MKIEVEIKAKLGDTRDSASEIESLLKGLSAEFQRSYEKSDIYFINTAGVTVRMRSDGSHSIITHKDKQLVNGVERNRETEFTVDDGSSFHRFLQVSGYREQSKKLKIGSAWQLHDILIEISEVRGLGWYIELEKLLPEGADEQAMREAEKQLRRLLSDLDISEDRIETRTYTSMLEAARKA